MDIFTKGALWDYWKMGSDETEPTEEEFPNLKDEYWSDEDDTAEIFKIETYIFNYKSPLCIAFNEFNYLLEVDPEFSNEYRFCNGGELSGMVRVGYMTYFQDHEWYNDLMDGSLKDEALKQKAIYEESWGDAKKV
ncbi:hypothetical protein Tco_0979055 [Tanacetum coccineum]|uniref:Uncharacterized protein n=1 Tax=Tanacetum coccineum TaxID=301880 RepID=A0ABQ5EQ31_9ASTR